jgi:predicted ATPase/signal transduction histidine kinase
MAHQDLLDLNFSSHIYGREEEYTKIQNLLMNEKSGKKLFISGPSGIGKTKLIDWAIQEFKHSQITLLNAKFDQIGQESVADPVNSILSEFFLKILSKDEEVLTLWRDRLNLHLGHNAKVLTDTIPELRTILGKVKMPPQLGEAEAQVRYEVTLANLFLLICKESKGKIVLFIDDLQWASSRSLELIKNILELNSKEDIIFLGSFRDEGSISEELKSLIGSKKNEVTLGALKLDSITEFLSDTFGAELFLGELAKELLSKTGGNPFHIIQFLKYIEARGIIKSVDGKWSCDLLNLKKQAITNNVLELLLSQLRELKIGEQEFLSTCSILGNEFSNELLDQIYDSSDEHSIEIINNLKRLSYLQYSNGLFQFTHDKIQEAAYELISEEEKHILHKRVGLKLLSSEKHGDDQSLLSSCYHLNMAHNILFNDEKVSLISLNVHSSRILKKTASFQKSLDFIHKAFIDLNLLDRDNELIEEIYLERANLLNLNGQYSNCREFINSVLKKEISKRTKVLLLNQLIIQGTAEGNYDDAIKQGKRGLSLLGMMLPENQLKEEVLKELNSVKDALGPKEISDLEFQNEMTDEDMKLAMNLLINMDSPCYLSNIDLYCIIVSKMVQISIKFGPVAESAKAYASYGIVLCSVNKNEIGYKFNQLGIKIANRFNHLGQLCRASHTMANHVLFWTQHIRQGDVVNDQGFAAGNDAGEYLWAGFIKLFKPYNQFFRAIDLKDLNKNIESGLNYCRKHPNQLGIDTLTGLNVITAELTETSRQVDSSFGHFEYVDQCKKSNSLMALSMYLSTKTFINILEGKFEEASELVDQSIDLLPYSYSVITNFYDDFSKAFLCIVNSTEKDPMLDESFKLHYNRVKALSESAPMNFDGFFKILEAELSIFKGEFYLGVELLEKSIDITRNSEFKHIEALANMRLFNHWENIKQSKFSKFYLELGVKLLNDWGAIGIAERLSLKHNLKNVEKFVSGSNLNDFFFDTATNKKEKLTRQQVLNKFIPILQKMSQSATVQFFEIGNKKELYCINKPEEGFHLLSSLAQFIFRTKKVIGLGEKDQDLVKVIESKEAINVIGMPVIDLGVVLIILEQKSSLSDEAYDAIKLLVKQLEVSLENIELTTKLAGFNLELENRVELRTKQLKVERDKAEAMSLELRTTQRELVMAAKNSGKVEVTSNILHNIGNSSTFMMGQLMLLKKKAIGNSNPEVLQVIIDRIKNYKQSPDKFMTEDDIGINLESFLSEVKELESTFLGEQVESIEKMESRLKGIVNLIRKEHLENDQYEIKEVIEIETLIDEATLFTALKDHVKHVVDIKVEIPVKLDVEKVKNILINLYSNSIYASSNLERTGEVFTTVSKVNEFLKIEVSDNGIGIKKENLNKVFNSGFSTKNSKGRGYGLHNSSIVAQNLLGKLECHSDGDGMGATFIIYIPFNAA